MKNIYQDNFTDDASRDVFSNSTPEESSAVQPQKPIRSAKHAPPPIKKSVIANKSTPESEGQGFNQPGFYPPQPVLFQPPVPQPYPVYFAPVNPQGFIPTGAYPPPSPAQPAAPSSPSQAENNEAGTRVLFQSDDFDYKEDPVNTENISSQYESDIDVDISEINLHSLKNKNPASDSKLQNFNVDEMEIGTYEFNILTAGQTSTSKSILTPEEEKRLSGINEENLIDEVIEQEPQPQKAKEKALPKKKSGLPKSEIIRRVIFAVSLLTIIVSGVCLLNEYRLHRENKKLMNDLSDMIITEPSTESTKPGSIPTTLPLEERPLSEQEQWEAIKSENPNIVFPEGMQLKYAKLFAQNPDLVGYLYAEGSELDTPVVQGKDDEEYVEKNFYGEYTKYACPFVTVRNTITEPFDDNTVIFGHHMRDGSIFGTLAQYRTLEGYKKAPVITFNTIYKDYSFKVIATMITNIKPQDDNGYVFTYYWTNLNNVLNHTAYLNQLSQRSLYDTGVDVLPTDKLLTLSTCCKDFEDARLVVVARLVRPGENPEVDTSLAIENKNPRYPQAYYDKLGKKNPYANAYQWEIS